MLTRSDPYIVRRRYFGPFCLRTAVEPPGFALNATPGPIAGTGVTSQTQHQAQGE